MRDKLVRFGLTSGLGALNWNCMIAIFAFSIRVGPPAAMTTFWLSTTPSTSSVSSMVPPTFLTTRMSRRSTVDDVGVTRRVTAATAIGANVEEYWETICHKFLSSSAPGAGDLDSIHLGVEGSTSCTKQASFVVQIHRSRYLSEKFHGFGRCFEEGLGDDRWVHSFL